MRSTIDKLLASLGLALAILLLIGGGLLTWASSFVGNQVSEQLAQQNITMPTDQTGLAELEPADQAALRPYAGLPMTTGDQAKAYADNFIGAHLRSMTQGKTFSEISNAAEEACPKRGTNDAPSAECTQLRQTSNTLFQGNTLRGLLLNAYAFGTMGKIAGIAAVAAFLGSALMLILGLLGFRHAKQVAPATAATTGTTTHVTTTGTTTTNGSTKADRV